MILRIRQCCCALTTFVRLVSVFFLVFHLLLALSAAIWYVLFSTSQGAIKDKNDESVVRPSGSEVDDRTFDSFLNRQGNLDDQHDDNGLQPRGSKLDLLIVILLAVFASIGIIVNMLVMVGIKVNKRSLFLPWLVFHLMAVLGKYL
jgi:hypothetical protein